MLGSSTGPICGVRDYSHAISDALVRRGARVSSSWLQADGYQGVTATRRWLDGLERLLAEEPPDWIFWHYSVFGYSRRGIPTLAPIVARAAKRAACPVLGVLHEPAYPFGRRGLRGNTQAASHRAALAYIYRALDAVVVTTEDRRVWFERCRWLPRKPILFLPVCSNVEFVPTHSHSAPIRGETLVGVIGFGEERAAIEPVVDAISHLSERWPRTRLVLVGAPGPVGPAADSWRRAALRYGIPSALSFTGLLDAHEYAQAIAELDLVLLSNPDGLSSRKTTLAAALAAGKPTVVLEGRESWQRIIDERAVVLAPRSAQEIESELERLIQNAQDRVELGRRARAFYERWQAPDVLAESLLEFLDQVDNARTSLH